MRLGPEMKPMIAVLQMEPDANGSWAIHGFVQDRKKKRETMRVHSAYRRLLAPVLDENMVRVLEGRNADIHG